MDNKNLTKVTDGKEIFNVYYSGGIWIREGTNNYYDEEDWQNNVIRIVKDSITLKPGCLYIHKKTGKPYTLITDYFMFKEDVILHLPFPVINSFLPKLFIFSTKVTSFPFSLAVIADIIPAGPPPITITFILNFLPY